MTTADQLDQAKDHYAFKRWHEAFVDGVEEFSAENCNKMQRIFDDLIADFLAKGESASEAERIESFRFVSLRFAIQATNELDEQTGMIETGEREELCKLTNIISLAVGLNPKNYGDGEGLASEWRDC